MPVHAPRRPAAVTEQHYRRVFDALAVAIWEHDASAVKEATCELRASGVADVRGYVGEHPDFVRRLKATMRFTDINATALSLLGIRRREDFLANLADYLPDDDETFASFIVAVDEDRPGFGGETWIRRTDGRRIAVKFAMRFPPGTDYCRIVNSMFDITETKALQEALERTRSELERALRMASLGELGATIAHEVNQPLSAVISYAQASRRWLDRGEPDIEEAKFAAGRAVVAAERAADVVKRVRKLMGKLEPERLPVSVETVLAEAIDYVSPQAARHAVAVSRRFGAAGAIVAGDRILLSQVFVNLLVNAFQALEGVDDRARRVAVSTAFDGEQVVVAVVDNGPGFEGNAGRGLEALFTTKANGMGLGLSISRSTIEAHDGTIEVRDNLGTSGARVEVVLPLAPDPAPSPGAELSLG